jgi:mycolipenoyl-CoA---2-(long-chain-fatty acyl)-trehalose mycolipenoyltransferase / long-chain-acyl-CoA---trehalose acyltransferase
VIKVAKVEVGMLYDWAPEPGSVVSWQPSAATFAKARQAPISAVPPSYTQAQHLRDYREYATLGLDMSRLVIAAWTIPGRCDVRAMTYVINTHLRRHDTYRSWFDHTDEEHIVHRIIGEPSDINLVPTKHGEMTPAELRSHLLATPDPLQWDCFRFAIIQRADHFTFCVCIDHLHTDAMFFGVAFAEIHIMYATVARGGAPISLPEAGSYHDYCVRQRQYTSALTLDSAEVRGWIELFENNNGTLPEWPLPLGDPLVSCDVIGAQLMDKRQTAEFESACLSVGARFSGGVFACAAMAEYELSGAETYYGIVPIDIRRTPADFLTTGWFIGYVPMTVPVASSFGETARAAQASFDSGRDLANVPLDRVLELAPWLRKPEWGAPLMFYLEAGIPPLSAVTNSQLGGLNAGHYGDGSVLLGRINIRVLRLENETQLVVVFPKNPIASESVSRYVKAMKSAFTSVAEGRTAIAPPQSVAYT